MKCLSKKRIAAVLGIAIIQLMQYSVCTAQNTETDQSIAHNRKGEIIIKAKRGAQVTVEQVSHEFWFGCALTDQMFNGSANASDEKQYKEKFLENFNSAVTENAVKWPNMERQRGKVNYSTVDAILKWTEENHIPLRGHNLFWGIPEYVQPWLKEMSDEELEQTLKNRAETITSRYKGRFHELDLNNEMVHGNYYEDRLGPDITRKMADWAKTGDPQIKLFLNDYDILTGVKLPEYMAQIRKLLKQGVPIAGIGVQGHLHAETFDRVQLKNALDSLAQFHLPIRITEFNMPGQRSKYYNDHNLTMTPEEQEAMAKELVDYYRICFAHPAVAGIVMWGFWEGANWIKPSSLYNKDWTPRPAAIAYHNLIYKEWWTSEKGITNRKGEYSVPAFFGKYKVTVNGQTKNVDLTKAAGKAVVEF
ncbi:MAG TPA: glycoside hydrolase [Prolixibacteraceae bacterium]|jgi:GH35 family endo-1,4-beta-xylanase|nr:glycoside hydrolase [Prolixibacteraceae bacterium]